MRIVIVLVVIDKGFFYGINSFYYQYQLTFCSSLSLQ